MIIARRLITLLIAVVALGAFGAAAASADSLYLNDANTGNVYRFNAMGNLNPIGPFSSPPVRTPPLVTPSGPGGILHLPDGTFLVAYQNPCGACPTPGEIDQFNSDGTFQRALVPATIDAAGNPNPDAPFAPHAMILGPDHRTLYVSDYGLTDIGAVETYDVVTGKLLGKLNFDSFIDSMKPPEREFHPRGLVFARDRRTLYLSLFSFKDFVHKGWILTYDIKNGDVRLLARYDPNAALRDCHRYLHRPDGMAIGRNQDLYVIGRSPGDGSTDKVLVFNRNTGVCRPWVDLDQPGTSARTYARALLFGPGGKLYVPMTVGSADPTGTDAGAVRAYDLHTFPVTYTEFVAPNPDVSWDYLTFGKTNPTTLAYSRHHQAETAHR